MHANSPRKEGKKPDSPPKEALEFSRKLRSTLLGEGVSDSPEIFYQPICPSKQRIEIKIKRGGTHGECILWLTFTGTLSSSCAGFVTFASHTRYGCASRDNQLRHYYKGKVYAVKKKIILKKVIQSLEISLLIFHLDDITRD